MRWPLQTSHEWRDSNTDESRMEMRVKSKRTSNDQPAVAHCRCGLLGTASAPGQPLSGSHGAVLIAIGGLGCSCFCLCFRQLFSASASCLPWTASSHSEQKPSSSPAEAATASCRTNILMTSVRSCNRPLRRQQRQRQRQRDLHPRPCCVSPPPVPPSPRASPLSASPHSKQIIQHRYRRNTSRC